MAPQLKLNTADFELLLGGRYLLESAGAGDNSGYQLEDGSGLYLLDTYVPQLGDPVTFTNPAWSGRVVSVEQRDIFQLQSNYNLVAVAATNSTAAPGGTAPGNFADVAVGGYYLLEDASGDYQLEDGSGRYVLEGTAFTFRNLALRKSQNQDGTASTYGSFETLEGGYAAGMTFTLTSLNLGLAAVSYTITNVATSFIGANPMTPLYLVEFGDAYQTLQSAGGGVLTRQGSTATQQLGVAMPGGTLAYVQVTAVQAGITTTADLTGLTVSVTVGSGRRIRLSGLASLSSSVAGDTVNLFAFEGATQLGVSSDDAPAAGSATPVVSVILTPTTGSHTYKLSASRSGTGTATLNAGATFPAYLLVEDIGT